MVMADSSDLEADGPFKKPDQSIICKDMAVIPLVIMVIQNAQESIGRIFPEDGSRWGRGRASIRQKSVQRPAVDKAFRRLVIKKKTGKRKSFEQFPVR
jgi:hypothetical protein